MKKSRGFRRRTRKKLKKGVREKLVVTRFLQKFKIGEKVMIEPEPSSHRGMPFPRFIGRTGIIKGMRGKSYIVEIRNGGKVKLIISRPEHLKLVK